MNAFDLRLDLDKSTNSRQVVRLRQGDHDGTVIAATIYDHGAALSGTVSACTFVMKLPDGTHYYRKGATWAGGTATVTVDERQAAGTVGRTRLAYFTLTVGTAQYSTGAFAVVVEPDAVGDAELPEDYDTAIQEAIDRCNAAAAALEDALPIGTANLANGAVTSQKLADGAVTEAKLASAVRMTALTNAEIDAITEGSN